jgi:hypothetical protein
MIEFMPMKLMKQKNKIFLLCEYMGPTSLLYIPVLLSHTHHAHIHARTHTTRPWLVYLLPCSGY